MVMLITFSNDIDHIYGHVDQSYRYYWSHFGGVMLITSSGHIVNIYRSYWSHLAVFVGVFVWSLFSTN